MRWMKRRRKELVLKETEPRWERYPNLVSVLVFWYGIISDSLNSESIFIKSIFKVPVKFF